VEKPRTSCSLHPALEATGLCILCDSPVCVQCAWTSPMGKVLCPRCASPYQKRYEWEGEATEATKETGATVARLLQELSAAQQIIAELETKLRAMRPEVPWVPPSGEAQQ